MNDQPSTIKEDQKQQASRRSQSITPPQPESPEQPRIQKIKPNSPSILEDSTSESTDSAISIQVPPFTSSRQQRRNTRVIQKLQRDPLILRPRTTRSIIRFCAQRQFFTSKQLYLIEALANHYFTRPYQRVSRTRLYNKYQHQEVSNQQIIRFNALAKIARQLNRPMSKQLDETISSKRSYSWYNQIAEERGINNAIEFRQLTRKQQHSIRALTTTAFNCEIIRSYHQQLKHAGMMLHMVNERLMIVRQQRRRPSNLENILQPLVQLAIDNAIIYIP